MSSSKIIKRIGKKEKHIFPKKKQENQDNQAINNIENTSSPYRPKGSSFHSKKDFKFQGNVNFNLNNNNNQNDNQNHLRSSTLQVSSKKGGVMKRSETMKKQESNNSENDQSQYSRLSIDTAVADDNRNSIRFQQVNIFGVPKSPHTPKTPPHKKLTLKKSISQRPSMISIFSRIKKKINLKLSDEEDFKVLTKKHFYKKKFSSVL